MVHGQESRPRNKPHLGTQRVRGVRSAARPENPHRVENDEKGEELEKCEKG